MHQKTKFNNQFVLQYSTIVPFNMAIYDIHVLVNSSCFLSLDTWTLSINYDLHYRYFCLEKPFDTHRGSLTILRWRMIMSCRQRKNFVHIFHWECMSIAQDENKKPRQEIGARTNKIRTLFWLLIFWKGLLTANLCFIAKSPNN